MYDEQDLFLALECHHLSAHEAEDDAVTDYKWTSKVTTVSVTIYGRARRSLIKRTVQVHAYPNACYSTHVRRGYLLLKSSLSLQSQSSNDKTDQSCTCDLGAGSTTVGVGSTSCTGRGTSPRWKSRC